MPLRGGKKKRFLGQGLWIGRTIGFILLISVSRLLVMLSRWWFDFALSAGLL